jgi:hypothetical protein
MQIMGLILDLLGEVLKSQLEADKLEFLIERLCLPTSIDMALTFFKAAKSEALLAFTNCIKTSRFPTLQEARTMDLVLDPAPSEESLDRVVTPAPSAESTESALILATVVPTVSDPWGGRTVVPTVSDPWGGRTR